MANITRSNGGGAQGSQNVQQQRDAFSLARELLGWDPFLRLDWPARQSAGTQPATFVPHFNVVERNDAYYVSADLPGVRDEEVDVTVHDNHLIVSGTRRAEERKEGENYFLYERRYGNFSRAFALPDNADAESVEAALNNGVLEVRIAKRESAKPRKIQLGGGRRTETTEKGGARS